MAQPRPKTFAEDDWQRLVESLTQNHNLIPVVGEELSRVILPDGSVVAWHKLLAEELAVTGAIPDGAPPFDWPGDLRLREGGFAGRVSKANDRLLRRVLAGELNHRNGTEPDAADLRLTEPLRLLAKIAAFPLVVTTAPDGLLLLALRIEAGEHDPTMPERADWSRRVVPLHFSIKANPADADLPDSWQPAPGVRTPLYHIFGMLRFLPSGCALRDAEQLEKIIELAGAKPHSGIIAEFTRCDILILGTHLPDCLAAAFIRLVKGSTCHETTMCETIASAEHARPSDPSLIGFLGTYGQTSIFEAGDAAAFIHAMFQRWQQAAAAKPAAVVAPILDDQRQPPQNCIFLSYASEDRALAQRIYDHLTARKIPVWYDRARLEGGEPWDEQLRHAVEKCRLFLPLITPRSARAPGPDGRYYLKEWVWAVERAPARTGTPYLHPLFPERLDATATAFVEKEFPRILVGQGCTSVDDLLSDEGTARLHAAYHKAGPAPRFLTGPTPPAATPPAAP